MVFSPLWNEPSQAREEARLPEHWASVAESAGERLASDLKRAEQHTGGWANRDLTDSLVDAALCECLMHLGRTGCWGPANRIPSNTLWNVAGSILEVGFLQHRARFKPCGYAGDYEMLARICQQTCCDHPLGQAFDRYFLRQSAPRAVRLRTRQTTVALVSHFLEVGKPVYHVLSYGCGPAIDMQRAATQLSADQRNSLRISLLDLDPDALDHAGQQLEPLLPASAVDCVRTNLFRVARSDRADSLGQPDFLVCPGLFDYLDQETAVATIAAFWERLAPRGLLLVGNFAPHNASRAYMEWIGNWYLTYRTPLEMKQLALRAGLPQDRFNIACEPSGVNLFLVARKS
jgi:hypothetical protein